MGVNMEIMAPGKRVYELRRLLKLTQKQLAVDLKDRTTLSNVENCKYNLTLDVAEKIAPILEKARIENNVRMQEITAEFLMRDEKKQADEIMERIIRELISFKKNANYKKNEFDLLCKNTQIFIRKYFVLLNENRIMEIYDLIINITCDIVEYKSCFNYSLSAYEVSTKFTSYDYRIKYLSKMIKMASKLGNFDTALVFCRFAFDLYKQFGIKKSQFLQEIYCNYILVLKKKAVADKIPELFERCFEAYEEAKKENCLDEESITHIKIILAEIYAEKKDYKKALMIDFEALDIAERIRNIDFIGIIAGNIAERAMELNDRELAVEYMNKTNESKEKQNAIFAASNSKVNVCMNIKYDNLQDVNKLYKNAINEGVKIRDQNHKMYIIEKVFEYFLDKNTNYMEEFLEFIKDKIISKEIDTNLQRLELLFFKASYRLGTKKIKSMTAEIEKFIEK